MMRIDPEFQSLIPPLTADEYSQLEENCLRDGILDPLIVWHVPNGDDILIDGHNRYRISEKHGGLPYKIERMTFDVRDDVKAWIIQNQLGRRNLSAYDRSLLALKLKPVIAEQAKEQQSSHTGQGYQKSDKAVHTAKQLAKIAGVSHDTIHKVETIEAGKDDRLKEQVRTGEVSINQAYMIAKGVPPNKSPQATRKEHMEAVKAEHESFEEKKAEGVVSFADVQADKRNREVIARDLYARCMGMGRQVKQIAFEDAEGDISLREMSKTLPDDKRELLMRELETIQSALREIHMEVAET